MELKDLTVFIGKKPILNNINLKVEPPFFLFITGENGSGKTVLINTILGFHKIKGKRRFPYKNILYIPDTPFFTEQFTVRQVLKTNSFFYKISITQQVEILNNLNFNQPMTSKISELSLGTRKKLELIPLFCDIFNVHILDEITNHLDKKTILIILDRILQLQNVILVDHNHIFINSLKKKLPKYQEVLCKNNTAHFL